MTYFIAEIGQNHNGDVKLAKYLVETAILSGVDAIKMQHFKAETLVDKELETMGHSSTHATMRERFKSLELPWSSYEWAREECSAYEVDLIISPFDLGSFDKCAELADKIKIASGDMAYEPILDKASMSGKELIVSTGMAVNSEISHAVSVLYPWALMHCVSLYPTPPNLANLNRIRALREQYPSPSMKVGYSDHCIGTRACLMAIAHGAEVIEKHFTVTPDIAMGDHVHSIDPSQMKQLISESLLFEEMLGNEWEKNERPDIGMRAWLRRGEGGVRDGTGS